MKIRSLPVLLATTVLLAACATPPPPTQGAPAPLPLRPYTMSDLRIPDTPVEAAPRERPDVRPTRAQARQITERANEAALDLPTLTCFKGKNCEYWYEPHKQYTVFVAYANQTLVCLDNGEVVRDVVVPGDQTLLKHEVYEYGAGLTGGQCVAFMASRPGLELQVSIFTSARKYDLNVQTFRTTRHVQVNWQYPEQYLAQLNGQVPQLRPVPERDRISGLAPRDRFCGYRLSGDTPAWRPVPTPDGQPPVCDDGEVTVINFKPGVLGSYDGPGLWRLNARGERMMVQYGRLNSTYRVAGVHDHLLLAIGAAEIRIDRESPHER